MNGYVTKITHVMNGGRSAGMRIYQNGLFLIIDIDAAQTSTI